MHRARLNYRRRLRSSSTSHRDCRHRNRTASESYTIATWEIPNFHVAIFYFPRRKEKIPPKFHLIPPKFHFFPTWRIFIFHVDIRDFPRGDPLGLPPKRLNYKPPDKAIKNIFLEKSHQWVECMPDLRNFQVCFLEIYCLVLLSMTLGTSQRHTRVSPFAHSNQAV